MLNDKIQLPTQTVLDKAMSDLRTLGGLKEAVLIVVDPQYHTKMKVLSGDINAAISLMEMALATLKDPRKRKQVTKKTDGGIIIPN